MTHITGSHHQPQQSLCLLNTSVSLSADLTKGVESLCQHRVPLVWYGVPLHTPRTLYHTLTIPTTSNPSPRHHHAHFPQLVPTTESGRAARPEPGYEDETGQQVGVVAGGVFTR